MDGQGIAIKVDGVSKAFKLPHERHGSLKNLLIHFTSRRRGYERLQVLKDINFDIKKGEFFGIVGRNGSGKSTLLKLIAGIYTPDRGHIHVNGQITPFIELGVGFNQELTGRENLFLNGALLGFSHKQMLEMYDDIVAFAELEKFMDQKLKNYSSGMQVRLAFSIAIRANSEILILDEVLAVGDAGFQEKCARYFDEIKGKRTVVFVSHDMKAVKRYCDRVVVLEKSEVIDKGAAEDMVLRYGSLMASEDLKVAKQTTNKGVHIGSGEARITSLELRSTTNRPIGEVHVGEPFVVRTHYETSSPITHPGLLFTLFSQQGDKLFSANTLFDEVKLPDFDGQGYFDVTFEHNPLAPGAYKVNVGIFDEKVVRPYDHVRDALDFVVGGDRSSDSRLSVKHSWRVSGK